MSDTKTKAVSALTADHAWWVVRGNWLPNGRKIAGPFSTQVDALHARTAIEKFTNESFFVDSLRGNVRDAD